MKTLLRSLFLGLATGVLGAEYHVAPNGSDRNPGTPDQPLATLAKARDAARGKPGATILVHPGTYWLEQTLELTPADSGLTIRAHGDTAPVLSGGRPIGGWRKLDAEPAGVTPDAKGKLWSADVPKGWCFHYLHVDGKSMPRAKLHNTHWRQWPTDFTRGTPTAKGQDVTFKNKAILQHIPSNGDVEMICIMTQYGVMGNGVMTRVNPEAGTAVWNSNQNHLGFRTRDPNRYTLENALPFIDQPGEWCVDSTAGKVYFWPESGDLTKAEVIAPKLYELIRFQGDEAANNWVENITIQGLTMSHTDRLPENQWLANWIVRQWEHPGAMVFIEGARDCAVADCRLLYSGASGVTLNRLCQGIRIAGCEIGWPGSTGVSLIGYGPGTLDVNKGNTITGNVIWVNGSARCGTIGVRPNERGNVINDNIRAAFIPAHADGPVNMNGVKHGFYTTDPSREPAYRLLQTIIDKANANGGLRGGPESVIPGPGEEISDAVQRILPKGSHMTIE